MELKELLAIENPTIAQFEKMEQALLNMSGETNQQLAAIDEEHRSMAPARLTGDDHGEQERMARREKARQSSEDISETLQKVRARHAELVVRLEKEADQAAWAKVKNLLGERREAMLAIDRHCAEIGSLFSTIEDLCKDIYKAMPVNLSHARLGETVGFRPEQIALFIVTRLYGGLGWPGRGQNVDMGYLASVHGNAIRCDGLVNAALGMIDSAILNLE